MSGPAVERRALNWNIWRGGDRKRLIETKKNILKVEKRKKNTENFGILKQFHILTYI